MSAVLSEDGVYRYRLDRVWGDPEGFKCAWLMLNPSTADADLDDPTIRKCRGFSERWGFDGLTVVNLYAYRATKPADLWAALTSGIDIVGPENDAHIEAVLQEQNHWEGEVIAAWGNHGRPFRIKDVLALPLSGNFSCLGKNNNGSPKHPLMVGYAVEREWWT